MRHYLNIPEHGILASYPLTLSILNHKTGVDEMNKLIKGTVDQQQAWSGSISDGIRCSILPWMKTPVIVKLEKKGEVELKREGPTLIGMDFSHLMYKKNPAAAERHYLNIPEHGIRASYPLTKEIMNWKNGVDEVNELIKDRVNQQIEGRGMTTDSIRCRLSWMTEAVEVTLEKEPAPQQQNVPKDEAHKKINPPLMVPGILDDLATRSLDIMKDNMLFGGPAKEMLEKLEHDFSKEWADKCNTRMKDRDNNTTPNPLDEEGSLINPAAARGWRDYNDREQAKLSEEILAVNTEIREEARRNCVVHAALAFDNTTGFTGMAHVDALRGQL